MMKPARSKPERLADVVDRGQRIADFLNDPIISQFIGDAIDDAQNDVLHLCREGSADQLRAAGIRLTALRGLCTYMHSVAADGARVLKNMGDV